MWRANVASDVQQGPWLLQPRYYTTPDTQGTAKLVEFEYETSNTCKQCENDQLQEG